MAHVDEHDIAVAVECRRVADRLDDTGAAALTSSERSVPMSMPGCHSAPS
jgi:hypothetical protein